MFNKLVKKIRRKAKYNQNFKEMFGALTIIGYILKNTIKEI